MRQSVNSAGRPPWRAWGAAVSSACLDAAFPPVCIGCTAATAMHGALCPACWPKIAFIERPLCPVLGTPMEFDFGDGMISASALADPPPFDMARSAVVHHGLGLKLASRLKYGDRADLARPMAQWMVRAGAELLPLCDIVVPVPLHRLRLLRRKFNQAAELAVHVSRLSGVPLRQDALVRGKATRSQVGLGRAERAANVAGAFRVPARTRQVIRGRTVLLVDDVYTTGATVGAATRALKAAGASRVLVLTFSRVAASVPPPHMWQDFSERPRTDGAGNGLYAAALRFLYKRKGASGQEGRFL